MASSEPFSFDSPRESAVKGALRSDFFYGYATAASQVEGAWNVDGKGESIWDTFAHASPSRVKDESTPDDAVRSYHLYKDDVKLLKSYGVNAYRFSLSWSRIIPLGGANDPVNEKGIEYYNNLIDELLANGITPFVTLFHWDMPQALEDRYCGMLNQAAYTPDFLRYAALCFTRFGDRVTHWITYNEPGVYALAGYAAGVHAPSRSSFRDRNPAGDSSTEPFIVAHTQLVTHARAALLYNSTFAPVQHGSIAITLHGDYSAPWDPSCPLDTAAAQRALEFEIAWFADPLYGSGPVAYPPSMRAQLGARLPDFTPEERQLVRGSSAFYGMNTYTTFYVRHRVEPPDITDHSGNIEKCDQNRAGESRGLETDTAWLRACPWGFRALLRWIWARYKVPIYMTENGTTAQGECSDGSGAPETSVLDDSFRVQFFRDYLTELAEAVRDDGVDVRSYFAWTFTDNWGECIQSPCRQNRGEGKI
ncbi:putative beta-glucosidase [Pseudovirgaria hyperparasitica]|uniref:Beta-glucosidase n=1 Tax=Pseudovirgaria hyperparasitica TaxID=470096 RepID=A0A6A6W5C7_9PEZI|nr:putative beta-glucosidase [Pseudovirgaria hyperparasitica]KAF2756261.1 putative beta-glucosidase [Pseudovirgaria hyperparasitica]